MAGCEQFSLGTRARDICDNEAGFSLKQTNKLRALYGIELLDGEDPPGPLTTANGAVVTRAAVNRSAGRAGGCGGCGSTATTPTVTPVVPATRVSVDGTGVGGRLIEIFKAAGLEACEACYALAGRMNEWGVDGSRKNLELIVADILPRAIEWEREKAGWLAKLLPESVTAGAVRLIVETAIATARPLEWIFSQPVPAQQPQAAPVARKRRPGPATKFVTRPNNGQQNAPTVPFAYTGGLPQFITTSRLMEDTKLLASKIPADVQGIIGVARSGLCVATMVAMLLHRPLTIVRQSTHDIVDAGNGWRLSGNTHGNGPHVLLDDTVMAGNSFKHVTPIVQKRFPNLITAAVYVNPAAKHKPDMWVHDLPWPHILEWNVFNSIMSPAMATDFDGILCRDCRADQDDDGEKYLDWMTNVEPLYLTRRSPIPLIVTARLEKYRGVTTAWLNKWSVTFNELVMAPWGTLAERRAQNIPAWKAGYVSKFCAKRHQINPPMYVESDPGQAQEIARLSRCLTVCPSAGACYK